VGILAKIADGWGTGNRLKIQPEGDIGVVVHTHPPIRESRTGLPFRQYFTLDGTVTGSNDLRVNGSSTPVEFCIPAEETKDRFVKFIAVKLADAGAKFDKFGALTALTNGVEFEWQSQELGSLVIHDGIKDNLEWFRMSNQIPTIIDLSGGGADAIIVGIDLSKMFGSQWGIKLTAGTNEKLIFRVNDNLSVGIDNFNIIAHGTKV
jgi:hypothetical protein